MEEVLRETRFGSHRLWLAAILVCCAGGLSGAQDSDTDQAQAAYREGSIAFARGDFENAAIALRRAIAIAPKNRDALFKLGRTLSRLEDWDAAIGAYERVLELHPDDAIALNNLANVYYRQDAYDEAANYYRKALEIRPDYILALYHYGWIQRHRNLADEAETLFRRCEQAEADSDRNLRTQLDCRFYLGTLRFRARDYAATRTLMEQVLGTWPKHSEARYYLGMSYLRLGLEDEGRQQLAIHRQMLRSRRNVEPIEKPID
jgi:tetratricopeptide (TPR) repeat protein